MRKVIVITAIVLLVYLILAFFTGSLVGLQGAKLWILRGALWFLGIVAAAVVVWFFWNKKKHEEAAEFTEEAAGQRGDIDLLIRDAESKLAAAQLEKGARLGHLPAILLIGDTGSAKTSTMVASGLDPELLAGQVYQESNLVPTRAANLWYAKHAIFVEAAGKTIAEPGGWAKIVKRLQPGRLGSAVGRGGPALRAALVMVEAESLIRPGATEALAATARTLRSRLGEISQTLGINLPVYVLFTKTDRVPFFAEFVRNLTNEEAAQVLGATVPLLTSRSGVYSEEETSRLTEVFERLFRSLANARPAFLQREREAPKLPGVYEFPREFRKLRPTLVQFLVDLCRPSHLTVGPFLRGFYFSGVRPIVINELASTPARAPQRQDREAALGATGVFNYSAQPQAVQSAPPQVVGTRKVPQWVFLSHFFNNLLLADRVAMGASGASTKTSLLRRILLATAAGLCLLYAILLMVSYSHNRSLENKVRNAAHGIETTADPGALKVASLDSLQRLETLRQSLAELTGFHRNGAPLSYRWGLYTGEDLYPHIRRIYFDSFRRVLFGQTQTGLLDNLRSLPLKPGPAYGPTYDTLKAYLITTSNHDKSTHEFLPPALMTRWSAGKTVDPERQALAQTQFDFYSDELQVENPYSSQNDAAAVTKARNYLRQFEGFDRVYAALLADAAKNTQSINFNKKFPGSAETVLDGYDVAGPFTKPGWDFMKTAFKNPTASLKGEAWVLGDAGSDPQAGSADLAKKLTSRYYSDFIKQWRAYLRGASVVKYKDIQDAAKKLNTLAGNSSPLLALFSLASANTAVDDPDVVKAFQPVAAVVPPANAERLVGGPNQTYMTALLTLQTAVEGAAGAQKLDDAVAAPTLKAAGDARTITRQVAQTFRADPEGRVDAMVYKLMEDPITNVEALLRRLGPEELNVKGRELCGQYKKLLAKYPFNSSPSAPQATIPDVNGIFAKPDGALWKFYNESLLKLLPKQGTQYVAAPGAVTLTPGFVNFFNNSAAFSELIYAGGTQDPHIAYTLKPLPSEGVLGLGLKLDGQVLSYKGGDVTPKPFTWQGAGAHGADATVNLGGPDLGWSSDEGLWAVFKFFAKAEWQPVGTANNLQWIPRIGNDVLKLPNGNALTVKFQIDMGGGPPVFQKGYLSRMGCVADVAR
jgi:type VI secretion system protein ImpL